MTVTLPSVTIGSHTLDLGSPDFLVFDPAIHMYRVGELKSFIKRDNSSLDPKDLDNARRQVAIGILALKDEAQRVGLSVPQDILSLLVFATPYGLKPSDPHAEAMLGEIEQIKRGMDAMRAAVFRLVDLKTDTETTLANLVDDFPINYRESCIGTCLMAARCREKSVHSPIQLGDAAARVFGKLDLEMMRPALYDDPTQLSESHLSFRTKAEETARVLGVDFEILREMIA